MYEDYEKSFRKNFDKLSMKYGNLLVFRDFMKMCAISIYNAFAQNQKMEKIYLATINSYEKEDQAIFPKMFGDLIKMYQTVDDIVDILGPFYEKEYLSDPYMGQFFTPSHIADLMAEINVGNKNDIEKLIEDKGFISTCEPTCGSGVLIISFAKILKSRGINYQQDLLVVANDLSEVCVYMTYIQLSLYGIPAIVHCGNALSLETKFKMETPFYFLQYWKFKNAFSKEETVNENATQNENTIDETILNNFREVMVKGNCQISLF